MNPDTTSTPRTDAVDEMNEDWDVVFAATTHLSRQLERELAEKTNEVVRLRKLMRDYINFIDENMGTTADWPMEAVFDNETTAKLHCDLLNAMKRKVKPEDIN